MDDLDPSDFDAGIRATVLRLWEAGFRTFTCCQGGRGHAFRNPTIGIDLEGDYFALRTRLAAFLHAEGCRVFEISLITCYDEEHEQGQDFMHVEGLDLLSPEIRSQAIKRIQRQERRLERELAKYLGLSTDG
ncbi:MAG TPA: hypothetical protein VGG64_24625 [Pirellulales bacterium]|jgi:hypothetical protein